MSDTTVMGVLDNMNEFASISAQMGDSLDRAGRTVSRSLQHFNATAEPSYQVGDCGPGLVALGDEIAGVDDFVRSIADALRKADTGTISIDVGAATTGHVLAHAARVERAAGDAALMILLRDFALFDAIRKGNADGTISIRDIEEAARTAKDPRVKASAQWLLDHPEVLLAIDEADADRWARPDGKITAKDVSRYMKQRAAYQVFNDSFNLFDSADGKRGDGKVSRNDIKRVVATTTDPDLKAAAQYLLDDERALAAHVAIGDRLAGKYDLANVAKQYAEPQSPLPLQTNWAREIGCGAAKQFSYLQYVDMLEKIGNDDPSVILDAAEQLDQEIALRSTAAVATNQALKKSATVLVSPHFAAAATAVDGICRITEPRKDWGTVTPRRKYEPASGPPSSKEVLSKLNAPKPAR